MSPSESEFLIHLIGEWISKKDTAFRKAISVQERLALTLRFLASGDSCVSLQYAQWVVGHVAHLPFLAPTLVCDVTHRHICMPLEYSDLR